MRFVTWNLCAGNTGAKLLRLATPPVVAVLCEVSEQPPAPTLTANRPEWLWEGELTDRGVAVASWGVGARRVAPSEGTAPGRFSLAAELVNGIGVVGLWSCPHGPKPSYAAEIHKTLDAFEGLMRSQPCVVAGDFNLSLGGKTDRRHGITERLGDLGYVSAYHAFHKVGFGAEQPTYFHRFKQDDPFYIDILFVPTDLVDAIRSVDIAPFDGWVTPGATRSDHVPVTVEIDLP